MQREFQTFFLGNFYIILTITWRAFVMGACVFEAHMAKSFIVLI
ncbi:hypothetical protein CCP2SC5_830011 [Azospirillaceae bacterium]